MQTAATSTSTTAYSMVESPSWQPNRPRLEIGGRRMRVTFVHDCARRRSGRCALRRLVGKMPFVPPRVPVARFFEIRQAALEWRLLLGASDAGGLAM